MMNNNDGNKNNNDNGFNDTPTPFLKDDVDIDKQMFVIEYDINQFTKAGYQLDYHGKKSAHSVVWNALIKLWERTPVDIGECREEHAICAVHGWTLPEVYAEAMCVDVNV